jgi:hypothetical protein
MLGLVFLFFDPPDFLARQGGHANSARGYYNRRRSVSGPASFVPRGPQSLLDELLNQLPQRHAIHPGTGFERSI